MPAKARIVIGLVCAVGFTAIAACVAYLPGAITWPYALTWAATVAFGAFPLSLRRGKDGSSVSLVTVGVFFSLARFGLAATLPLAASGAWAMTRGQRHTRHKTVRLLFNVAVVVIATASAGTALDGAGALFVPVALAGLLSAVAYFAVNSLLVAAVVAAMSGGSLVQYWRETGLMAAPMVLVCGASGVVAAASLQEPRDAVVGVAILGTIYLTYSGFASYVTQVQERSKVAEEASALNLRIAESLTLAMSSPHGATYEQLQQLQAWGRAIADRLGLASALHRHLALVVLLRDIGMLAVPREVRGQLAPRSLSDSVRVRAHPTLSVDMLSGAGLPDDVLAAIAAHHEHWDGSGYPNGIAGTPIPALSRIVAVLDYVEGLQHAPAGMAPRTEAEVRRRVDEHSGTRFDPEVVAAFLSVYSAAGPGPQAESDLDAAQPNARQTGAFHAITLAQREAHVLFQLGETLQSPGSVEDAIGATAEALASLLPVRLVDFMPPPGEPWPAVRAHAGVAHHDALPGPPGATEPGVSRVSSSMRLPLFDAGVPLGTLVLTAVPGCHFDVEHERIVGHVGSLLARRVAAGRLLSVAQRDASTDVLTGLPNRRSVRLRAIEDIDRCAQADMPLAVFMVDLDGFKALNDAFGHAQGDVALRAAADCLRGAVRACDTVARLGGDEFVVLLPGCGPGDGAGRQQVLQDRLGLLRVETQAGAVRLAGSVGAAYFPEDGRDIDHLFEVADARMYADKQRRRRVA